MEVLPAAADDAREEAEDAALEILDPADDAREDTDEPAEDALDEAPDASDEALLAAPPPKMVVDPMVEVIREDPDVETEMIAEVVIAEDNPEEPEEPEDPDPAPPP